jgi:hypothetical protein
MAWQRLEDTQSYLVEHYQPGIPLSELKSWVGRVRAAVDELEHDGNPVRLVRSTIVPADESLLCVFEAASEALVREAYGRAGVQFERISVALSEGSGGPRLRTRAEGRGER